MTTEDDLWDLVAARREGVLATISRDGRPQLSNVLYVVDDATRVVRVSTTANRLKARNLARDPRASLHVEGDDFWHFAVAEGRSELSGIATEPGDDAETELGAIQAAFYGPLHELASFDREMIENQRLVVRLHVMHLYGVLSSSGRRPLSLSE